MGLLSRVYYLVPVIGSLILAGCTQDTSSSTATGKGIDQVTIASADPVQFSDILNRSGLPRQVQGSLYLPNQFSAPYPAVVISHGSGGIRGDREEKYAKALNDVGIAALIPRSNQSRTVGSTSNDQGQVSFASVLQDDLAALKLLANDPRIRPDKIGIMGFSRGGVMSNLSAHLPFAKAVAGDGVQFAAHLSVYPGCNWRVENWVTAKTPFLMLMGAKDDWTPISSCEPIIDRLRAAGTPIEVKIYPGAYHGFDTLPRVVRDPNVEVALCPTEINEKGEGKLVGPNVPSGTALGRDWPGYIATIVRVCGRRGATVGSERNFQDEVTKDIVTFFTRTLK